MSRKTKEKKRKQHLKQQQTRQIPSWVCPLGLGLLVLGTFLLRVVPGWNNVMVNGQVWYREVDAWYHMRLADNMMVNFPFPLKWDTLVLFPNGWNVGYFPLLSWIIVILGHVSNYELVGAFIPPILGALVLIPIYFICKTLWKDWVGLVACGLVMILPSELFHRTLLGFTDHHILEIFFLVCTILFLILLTKKRKLKWVILSGISLGLYLSSWGGGALLVLILWIWFLISFILKLNKKENVKVFCKDISIIFGLGTLIFFPNIFFILGMKPYLILFCLVSVSPLILELLSRRFNWKIVLSGTIGGLFLVILGIHIFSPTLFSVARSVFLSPESVIQEARPVDLNVLMSHYGISFFLFLGGLIFAIKRKENLLMIVWCISMLILCLCQRRWSYYFTINDAILTGYFIYLIAGWVHKNTRQAVAIITCILLLATTIKGTIGIANLPGILSPGWYNACTWLRENTPEVEGYYSLNASKTSYGVLSWWDFGDFILRVGRRVPCSNPMLQTSEIQWKVFLASSEEEANSNLTGVDYIMVDYDMVSGKLYAIVQLDPNQVNITNDTFIIKLWNEETTTWKKVYQSNEVKVYGRA